jgi:magnesium chelatase family protein
MARDGVLNARLAGRRLRTRTHLDAAGQRLLTNAMTKMSLTARAHDRLLRTARTIADLADSECVAAEHLAEALQFRGE